MLLKLAQNKKDVFHGGKKRRFYNFHAGKFCTLYLFEKEILVTASKTFVYD